MKKFLFILSIIVLSFNGFSQEKNSSFPENSVGIYKGILHINASGRTQNIPMEFHLLKTDSVHKFDYKLIYDGHPRNYTLVVKDKKKGICDIDEHNSIIIPAKFANNILYSFFEVQGNFISTRFAFYKDKMEFDLLFTLPKNKTTSGGTSKDIPKVFGFPIATVQTAVLKKVE